MRLDTAVGRHFGCVMRAGHAFAPGYPLRQSHSRRSFHRGAMLHIGGLYTKTSDVRQCQIVSPPPPWPTQAGCMTTMGVEFCTRADRVDRDWLWRELADHAYWAKYCTRGIFEQQLDTAWRIVGAYDAGDGRMVGFSRAFSDSVSLAYLANVYVHRHERGRGIGSEILRIMIEQGPGRDFRWMPHTNDPLKPHSSVCF